MVSKQLGFVHPVNQDAESEGEGNAEPPTKIQVKKHLVLVTAAGQHMWPERVKTKFS